MPKKASQSNAIGYDIARHRAIKRVRSLASEIIESKLVGERLRYICFVVPLIAVLLIGLFLKIKAAVSRGNRF